MPPNPESDWKKNARTLFAVAIFLVFWAAVIYGVWTGGRYVVGRVSDYFHPPTPDPKSSSKRPPSKPSPTPAGTLDWKEFKPGGSTFRLFPTPAATPTPTPGIKPFGGLDRREPATELIFPGLLKTPTPTPTPSFNEQLKKILGNQPAPAPAPEKPVK